MKEYKIGETFVQDGKTIKVVESESCGDCVFTRSCNVLCFPKDRKDNKSVKFIIQPQSEQNLQSVIKAIEFRSKMTGDVVLKGCMKDWIEQLKLVANQI